MNDEQKSIKSVIFLDEVVDNKDAYRTANKKYYPAYAISEVNDDCPMLFTRKELDKAITRAEKNPEDILPKFEEKKEKCAGIQIKDIVRSWFP